MRRGGLFKYPAAPVGLDRVLESNRCRKSQRVLLRGMWRDDKNRRTQGLVGVTHVKERQLAEDVGKQE